MKPLVRVQLIALGALIAGVVYAQTRQPDEPAGVLRLGDVGGRLEARTLVLTDPTSIVVSATAAPGEDGTYQAYPWIVERATRRIVFHPDSTAPVERRRRTHAFRDTLRLGAGTYDVFYTPFGMDEDADDGLFGISFGADRRWRASRDEWGIEIVALGGRPLDTRRWSYSESRPAGDEVLWSASGRSEQILRVLQPDTLRLAAVTAQADRRGDHVIVSRLPGGEEVWRLSDADAQPAGGSPRYSRVEAALPVEPGFYRIANRIATPNPRSWMANPPLDVASYGVTVRASPGVRSFGVWDEDMQPVVSIEHPGNDAYVRRPFAVERAADVVAFAMGELDDDGDRFDFALVRNEDTGRIVWEMQRSASRPAGGDDNLRVAEQILRLEPGRYELVYLSDDSRSPDDAFLDEPPDHPERWGAYLFAPFDSAAVTGRVGWTDRHLDSALASVLRVGNDAERTTLFTLDRATEVRVEALLEYDGDWYDTARLTDASTGRELWAVDRVDPVPDARNRDFAWARSVVTLEPGTYKLSVETDGALAYDDWGGDVVSEPERYGVAVYPLVR